MKKNTFLQTSSQTGGPFFAYGLTAQQYKYDFPSLVSGDLRKKDLIGQKIKMPTLYLHGKNDGCIGANLSDGMENFFEDLQINILPNCGHFLHLEKPEEVNKIILDFLSS